MNVLLVGAGAVGQVYGRHLQRGGAEIGFFVRPEYKDDVRSGMTLYPLSEDGTATTLRTSVVKTDIDDLADEGWEQIWLCTSSPALWSGPEDWITRLVAAAPQATIVSLQPGYQASRYLAERVPAARLVTGLIAFIAWQAPLPGETADPPGIRYWLPPMTPSPFMGPARLVDPIVETLQQGGIRASRVNNLASQAILPTAALSSAVSGLEIAGWSFDALRSDGRLLKQIARAARQAVAVSALQFGVSPPRAAMLIRSGALKTLLRTAPSAVPFDLETYLAFHFTKVGDQTRQTLDSWIAAGQAAGKPVDAIAALREQLPTRAP